MKLHPAKMQEIAIADLVPNRCCPPSRVEGVGFLHFAIRTTNIIYPPLVVPLRRDGVAVVGKFEVIEGHRRIQVAIDLGLKSLQCLVIMQRIVINDAEYLDPCDLFRSLQADQADPVRSRSRRRQWQFKQT
jgi:hypothetical protein